MVDYDTYFCPVGGGRCDWPKKPPNYLAFPSLSPNPARSRPDAGGPA